MPAMLPSDRTFLFADALRSTYERRKRVAERFAKHAADINDKSVADHFLREAKVWDEAIDFLTERLQVEAGR